MPFFKSKTSERQAEPAQGLGSRPQSGEKGLMARGKNTHPGLGNKNPNRSTRLGLRVQKKKIVTKRGLVAPSPHDPERLEEFVPESDRRGRESEIVRKNVQPSEPPSEAAPVMQKTTDPLGLVPPPHLDQKQLEPSDLPEDFEEMRDSTRELETDPIGSERPLPFDIEPVSEPGRIAGHEDVTPQEGTDLDDLEDPDLRQRFRTAPGGGKNRVSGGREQAKAYVSPTTLRPSTPVPPITSAVKVLDVVENAVRAYRTEPSLLKRRASSLPPKFPKDQPRTHLLVGGVALGIVLAAMALWAMLRTQQIQAPTTGPSSSVSEEAGLPEEAGLRQASSKGASSRATQPEPAAPAAHQEAPPTKKTKISRNESETGPKTEPEGENAQAKPTDSAEKTAGPSDPSPSPVHEEAPVAKPPRTSAQAPVNQAVSSEAKEIPAKPAGSAPATKTSSQDLWLE